MPDFADRLKEERKRMGMSQADCADVLNASKRTVSDWERKVTSPTATQLEKFYQAGVDVPYLFTGLRQGQLNTPQCALSAKENTMQLEKLEHTLDTLVPQMAGGFIVKTGSGEFLLHKNYGLDDAIAQIKTVLENRQRHWAKHSHASAMSQLDRYIELMGTTPGGASAVQVAQLQGYLEGLYFADLISDEEASIYSRTIKAVGGGNCNPFLAEGRHCALGDDQDLPAFLRAQAE